MAAGTATLTVEQFLALPEEQQFRKELLGGEVVEMGNAKAIHEIMKGSLWRPLLLMAPIIANTSCSPNPCFA